MFGKLLGRLLFGGAIFAMGILSASGADTPKSEIKGGIEGKVIKVDVDKGMLTIAREDGRERSFSITDETTIVGPHGGVVHRRLRDSRFHAGLPITVVASGETATELHLGFDRKARKGTTVAGSATSPSTGSGTADEPSPPATTRRTSRFRGILSSKSAAEKEAAKTDESEGDDNDFPGKIKSVDPNRRLLVITLLNGKDRSFMLARDVKITVNGHTSRLGLADTMFKPGIPLTVVTEEGGRKVKEVKVTPAVGRKLKTGG
jgi:hypothetical protein